jgi:hypothetical protein
MSVHFVGQTIVFCVPALHSAASVEQAFSPATGWRQASRRILLADCHFPEHVTNQDEAEG